MVRLAAVLLPLLLSATLAAQAPATVIRAGVLIDPATGNATRNQTIVVEKGRITAVGASPAVPGGATIVDMSRHAVLPGLFDAHTHLCLDMNVERDAGSYFYTTLRDSTATRAVQGVVNARTMLEAGFTTVRDVGNEGNYACSSVRAAIDRGAIPGPTLLNAGRIIAPFGGQFRVTPDMRGLAEPEYFFADTRDEMRKAVRENAHFGARVIKIVVDDQRYIYSEDDIRFIVAEAAASGMKVAAHVWTGPGAHNAAAAGVATLEHLNGISDDDLDLARRNGVTAVFTPFPVSLLSLFRLDDGGKAEYATQIDRLRNAYRKGVAIAYGTDAITQLPMRNRGETAIQYVDSYVEAGFTAKDLLQTMTVNAARALGVERTRGAIAAGMAADISATDGNPLDDVQALKRVAFVMKDGRIVRQPAVTR